MPDRRLYAKFSLDFADSHKIAPLSDSAFRAYVRMVLWSRRMLTDGRIPGPMALIIAGKQKVLAELTSNDAAQPSLWRDPDGDYWIHDFLEHQSSKAQVEAKQVTNRANGALGGQAKAQRNVSEPPSESVGESLSDRVARFYTETETETSLPPEGGRKAPTPPVDNSLRPTSHCPRHPGGTTRPCKACGDARRSYDAWTPTAVPVTRRPASWDTTTHCEHGRLIDSCDICAYEKKRASVVIHAQFGTGAA